MEGPVFGIPEDRRSRVSPDLGTGVGFGASSGATLGNRASSSRMAKVPGSLSGDEKSFCRRTARPASAAVRRLSFLRWTRGPRSTAASTRANPGGPRHSAGPPTRNRSSPADPAGSRRWHPTARSTEVRRSHRMTATSRKGLFFLPVFSRQGSTVRQSPRGHRRENRAVPGEREPLDGRRLRNRRPGVG